MRKLEVQIAHQRSFPRTLLPSCPLTPLPSHPRTLAPSCPRTLLLPYPRTLAPSYPVTPLLGTGRASDYVREEEERAILGITRNEYYLLPSPTITK